MCEDKCKYFCKHGQNRLLVARAKKNTKAEQQILEIIRREQEWAFWRRLNYSMSKKRGRGVSAIQVKHADGTTYEASGQRGVEETIWNEIHGKRFYIAEQAPICQGKLRGIFGYMANNTYQCPEGTSKGTIDLF